MGMTEPSGGTDVLGMKTTARARRRRLRPQGPQGAHHQRARGRRLPRLRQARRAHHLVRGRAHRSPASRPTSPTHKMGMRASTMGEIVLDDVRRARREPARRRGRRHPQHDAQPRDRAPHARGDEPRHRRSLPRHHGDLRRASGTAFGKPIAEHGQIQRYIGESYAKTEAARALIYNVARTSRPDRTQPPRHRRRQALRRARRQGGRRQRDAGARRLGLLHEYKVERFLRDAKLLEIGGGTLESHQKNMTRDLTES